MVSLRITKCIIYCKNYTESGAAYRFVFLYQAYSAKDKHPAANPKTMCKIHCSICLYQRQTGKADGLSEVVFNETCSLDL